MKKILTVLLAILLATAVLSGCKQKSKTSVEAIAEGTYDWDKAREVCISDLKNVLKVAIAGESDTYAKTRNEWLPRIEPAVQGFMFPATYPPQGCSATVTYLGYSAPEYNSDNAEYVAFIARMLNNETLESVDFDIVIQLSRGRDGYIISGFSKEVITNER